MSEQEVQPEWGRVRYVLTRYQISRTTLREWIALGLVDARHLGPRGDLLINIPSIERHVSSGLSNARIDPASVLSESHRQLRLKRKNLAPKKRRGLRRG